MITAMDMVLASQRCHYDGSAVMWHKASQIHASDVACQIRDTAETRRQNDNPYYVEHLDYRVSLCTVAQEARKLRSMVKCGQGYNGNAYGYLSASNQAFARMLACSGSLSFYKAR